MDGKRQGLETFRNKLVDARRRGFHFEQVRSRNVARRQNYERNEKSADRQTDGFSSLYSRDSKCTCPIVQEHMNVTMALSSIASLNMFHSRLFKEETTAASPEH